MITIDIKQGASFIYEGTVQQNNLPVDITGWQILCQLRSSSKLVSTATSSVLDGPAGRFQISIPSSETATWRPNTDMDADIRYTTPSNFVQLTQTFRVRCLPGVSRGV